MDLSILSLLAQATLVAKAVLVILLVMSVASWALMFRKWLNIRAGLKKAADGMDRFNHARDLREAVQSLGGDPASPLYTVAHEGVTEFNRSKEAGNSEEVVVDNVRRSLRQGVDMEMTRLTSSLSFLATAANTAPFIGLFGTVWGIMSTFHAIGAMKSASLATVAPGISEALIATAMGPHVTQFITDHQGFFLAEFFKKVGPNLMGMFIAFACLYWVGMSRIIRGQILTLKKQEYVTAARALGASSGRIIKRHLLPNCIGQIVATTCLQIPSAIFTESFMSFLGVGVLAPLTSLGSMCSDALGGISTYPYRLIIPAIIISIMILSFNLFGDGLRDALDPRLKK